MRIRVRVDVRHPLKREKKVKSQGGDWCIVNFKYEKLGIFCFVCGIMGHAENKCEVRFAMERDDGVRAWSNELRADYRRRGGRPASRWLSEEGGSSGVTDKRNNPGSEFTTSGPRVVPTYPNEQPVQSQNSTHVAFDSTIVIAPAVNPVTIPLNSVNHQPLAQLSPQFNPLDPQTSIHAATQLLPHYHIAKPSISTNQPKNNVTSADNHLSDQLFPNYDPDKTFSTKLSPNNNPAATLITMSPTITENINQQSLFSFQSPKLTHLDIINNPLNRPNKSNPTHKLNRALPYPNRINPKINQNDPRKNPVILEPVLTRNPSEDMEVQTEKKRRREDVKKETDGNSESSKHFLSAGPGSQACRDQ
jgi:hypothetical protein